MYFITKVEIAFVLVSIVGARHMVDDFMGFSERLVQCIQGYCLIISTIASLNLAFALLVSFLLIILLLLIDLLLSFPPPSGFSFHSYKQVLIFRRLLIS